MKTHARLPRKQTLAKARGFYSSLILKSKGLLRGCILTISAAKGVQRQQQSTRQSERGFDIEGLVVCQSKTATDEATQPNDDSNRSQIGVASRYVEAQIAGGDGTVPSEMNDGAHPSTVQPGGSRMSQDASAKDLDFIKIAPVTAPGWPAVTRLSSGSPHPAR